MKGNARTTAEGAQPVQRGAGDSRLQEGGTKEQKKMTCLGM